MSGLWKNDAATPEGKYPILLRRDGSVVTKPYFVMLASDPAAPQALMAYAASAEHLGFDSEYVGDVKRLALEFQDWLSSDKTGDPDAPKHRKDDPAILAWARSSRTRSA